MSIFDKDAPFLKVGTVNELPKATDSDFKVEQGDGEAFVGENSIGKCK